MLVQLYSLQKVRLQAVIPEQDTCQASAAGAGLPQALRSAGSILYCSLSEPSGLEGGEAGPACLYCVTFLPLLSRLCASKQLLLSSVSSTDYRFTIAIKCRAEHRQNMLSIFRAGFETLNMCGTVCGTPSHSWLATEEGDVQTACREHQSFMV